MYLLSSVKRDMPRIEGVANNGRKWIYMGDAVNNVRQGYGICWWENGDRYEGEWSNGKTNGVGYYRQQDGAHYRGQFLEHKMDGFGICIYADGDKNEGQWKDGSFLNECAVPEAILEGVKVAAERARITCALQGGAPVGGASLPM
jgi:hypothetical protein